MESNIFYWQVVVARRKNKKGKAYTMECAREKRLPWVVYNKAELIASCNTKGLRKVELQSKEAFRESQKEKRWYTAMTCPQV